VSWGGGQMLHWLYWVCWLFVDASTTPWAKSPGPWHRKKFAGAVTAREPIPALGERNAALGLDAVLFPCRATGCFVGLDEQGAMAWPRWPVAMSRAFSAQDRFETANPGLRYARPGLV
jgi:hypothetical protein